MKLISIPDPGDPENYYVIEPEGGRMKVIYKYQLQTTDEQVINMPVDHKVLHVGGQDKVLTMWVEVEADGPTEDFLIEIMGTGNEYEEENRKHIGSAVCPPFVWHVFIRE